MKKVSMYPHKQIGEDTRSKLFSDKTLAGLNHPKTNLMDDISFY